MGIYLNPGNGLFLSRIRSKIYVDHTLLIEKTNDVVGTDDNKLCVSRPRRFGKSTDANMLVAYYSKGCQSDDIFNGLKIHDTEKYQDHLNCHNVIHMNMQQFLSDVSSVEKMIQLLNVKISRELRRTFCDVDYYEEGMKNDCTEIYSQKNESFIFIIDEWDCIFRKKSVSKDEQEFYLDFLRNLLKDQPYVELVYMTGILPIKKYGTHSALNMFDEISMISPKKYAQFMGFTEEEVEDLCQEQQVDYEEMKQWYDGYHLTKTISTFSPRSVVASFVYEEFGNYWTSTETYEALKEYIDMNYDGLKDAVVCLLAGESVDVDTISFQNDMTTFESKDDVLTLLIHLGYLAYDKENQRCYIPNMEVVDSFIASIKNSNWDMVTTMFQNSKKLLEATWNLDSEKVAEFIEEAHLDTSILTYNNENALAYTIMLAYIAGKNHYKIIREMPTGRGFADIVFVPYKDKPAMIVELKWNQDADTALKQIKDKKYPKVLEGYTDNLLLVGISYDKKTKKHNCVIEQG